MRPSPRKFLALLLAAAAACAFPAHAADAPMLEFKSGPDKVRVVELYSSQSRSSCPPAEAWFSTLRDHPGLWKEIAPVSFHVTRFDKRGWKDRLATAPEFTARFVGWISRWRASTPYVPTVVVDGVEWDGWAKEKALPAPVYVPSGKLTVKRISENEYRVLYVPEEGARGPWVANGALLGFGVKTRVEAGENIGKTLTQDFVALKHHRTSTELTRDGFRGTLRLPAKGEGAALAKEGMGLVVWVSRGDDLLPVQAAGGFLPGYRKKK